MEKRDLSVLRALIADAAFFLGLLAMSLSSSFCLVIGKISSVPPRFVVFLCPVGSSGFGQTEARRSLAVNQEQVYAHGERWMGSPAGGQEA